VISAIGFAFRIDATAGSVCTTSPSELGLMIRMLLMVVVDFFLCVSHDPKQIPDLSITSAITDRGTAGEALIVT
jgi:hypothetical protein